MRGISRKRVIVLFLVIAVVVCGAYAVKTNMIGERDAITVDQAGRPFEDGATGFGGPENPSFGSVADVDEKADATKEQGGERVSTIHQSADSGSSLPGLSEKAIKTATIEIGVGKDKFNIVYDKAVEIANSSGGYISRSNSTTRSDGKIAGGELIVRIPAKKFDPVLKSLKKLGKLKNLAISSEEVTSEFVDLQSRLRNWRAQEVVMLDLMERAKTISESISIQNNLQQIQMEIEQISGRLKYLDDRVNYSEIRLYINEPSVIPYEEKQGIEAAFDKALNASLSMISSIIIAIGYLMPLVIIGALLLIAYIPIKKYVISKDN
jgi:hypothetical protein